MNNNITDSSYTYKDYGSWIREKLGCKVQKISIDAGFSCPNRDGRISSGGCIYCNNYTFNPTYCSETAKRNSPEETIMLQAENIKLQLRKGKAFFSRKYPEMKYIAYFQSYTNTYAPLAHLRSLYEAALNEDDVVGISIATRPDCINEEILDYLSELSQHYFVTLEYGIESLNDETLLKIKRGHTVQCSIDAIKKTHQRGITTCAHMILGLPGETISDMQEQADLLFSLPIDIVKLHQLQITRGTALAQDCALQRQCTLFTPEEYIELVTYYIKHAKPDTIFERFTSQSPDSLLIAPRWGLKNHEFTNLLKLRLSKTNRKNED